MLTRKRHSLVRPSSCDTFVALPPATANGCVIFGKNSDRLVGEVQEVIYCAAANHNSGGKLTCTYIDIDQVPLTHAVILSKPSWMWGAEMGANEHGVCIGNEAVYSKVRGPQDAEEKLTGMDLVRLGLERSTSAREALDIITSLLEKHGQGGPCSEQAPEMIYHNSYLIADRSEAWVLETAASYWAAEQITSGVRNISNDLTIRTKIDAMSEGLKEKCQELGLWQPEDGEFDFTKAFSEPSDEGRYKCGKELLKVLSASGNFKVKDMFQILRDEPSGINMTGVIFATMGSQVSALSPPGSAKPCCHWFTGTPYPHHSVFKPFIFCPVIRFSSHIVSPTFGSKDPAKIKPRFQNSVDRRHLLYKAHEKVLNLFEEQHNSKGQELKKTLHELEAQCVEDIESFLNTFNDKKFKEVEELFKDLVESEMKFYK